MVKQHHARMANNTTQNAPPSDAGRPEPGTGSDFIDQTEFLRRVPVSRRTLATWRFSGKIPYVAVSGSRRVLFHWPTVEATLLRAQRNTG